MDKKDNKTRLILLIILLVMFSIIFFYVDKDDNKDLSSVESHLRELPISVNIPSGMYNNDLDIDITSNIRGDVDIYYTLDGSEPTRESNLYHGGIILELEKDTIKAYNLKVVFDYKGELSEVYEYDYIMNGLGEDITLPIINLSIDPDELYNEETGIFAIENVLDRSVDFIRGSHIYMIDTNGNELLNQYVGMQVSGGSSSSYEIKSLKINAGYEWDINHDKLLLPFLNDEYQYMNYSHIYEYDSIRLRSGSQNFKRANINTAITSRIVNPDYFEESYNQIRCLVFLNGEIYGIMDIQDVYSDDYIANKFNLNKNKIEKIKGKENTIFEETGIINLFNKNLDVEENRLALEKVVDMDSFMEYYAINILLRNADWPNNNYEIWRYVGKYDESNKYTDGRYRFLIKDLDTIYYGRTEYDAESADDAIYTDVLTNLYNHKYNGAKSVFTNFINSNYYRNKFVVYLTTLMSETFTDERISQIIDEEYNKIANYSKIFFGDEYYKIQKRCYEESRIVALNRDSEVDHFLRTSFKYKDKYTLNIVNSSHAVTNFGSVRLVHSSDYSIDFYLGVYPEIKSISDDNYTIKGFLINDTDFIEGTTLTLEKNYINDGNVKIEIVEEELDNPKIIITELFSSTDYDWIVISNNSSKSINLNNYYISDNNNNIKKYKLPSIDLESGEKIKISGKKNFYKVGEYQSNFNIKAGETLYIYDDELKEIIESMVVPVTGENETYGRLDNSNVFVYYKNTNNERTNLY